MSSSSNFNNLNSIQTLTNSQNITSKNVKNVKSSNAKFIAKNRYVYDEKFDTPLNWPVWPSNIYITSQPVVYNSNQVFLPQFDTYSSDTSDESFLYSSSSYESEPQQKRVRLNTLTTPPTLPSPTPPSPPLSQSTSEPAEGIENELDCDFLSCLLSFGDGDELLDSADFF